MAPTHAEARAASKRVNAANAAGTMADTWDQITMAVYHLSLLMRTVPEPHRMAQALRLARLLVENTRESMG